MIRKIFDPESKSPEELNEIFFAYQQAINVNIISSITDTTGKILYVNDKFCEVSKYSAEELIGQNHRIINSGYHGSEFFKEMWKTIGTGQAWHNEILNKAKDGSLYWVDTVVLPIRNKEGKTEQYLSLRTLITEKKLAEKERQEYIKELNTLLHMTSHKVRKPLSTCLGLMNLFDSGKVFSAAEIKDMIGHLKSSALDLDGFVRELVTFVFELEKKFEQKSDVN